MDKKIIEDAMELTSRISGSDILTPLNQEEVDLTPYPEVEFDVVVEPTIEKFKKKINDMSKNGRQAEGGMNVVQSMGGVKFYQLMCRWNIDKCEDENVDSGLKPEMPSQNSEAGTMGPKPLYIPGLEDEPDLYEDVNENATNG